MDNSQTYQIRTKDKVLHSAALPMYFLEMAIKEATERQETIVVQDNVSCTVACTVDKFGRVM